MVQQKKIFQFNISWELHFIYPISHFFPEASKMQLFHYTKRRDSDAGQDVYLAGKLHLQETPGNLPERIKKWHLKIHLCQCLIYFSSRPFVVLKALCLKKNLDRLWKVQGTDCRNY